MQVRVLKWHFASLEDDDHGVNESRGHACEIVAWRFLTHLSQHELINHLLCELSATSEAVEQAHIGITNGDIEHGAGTRRHKITNERTNLLADTDPLRNGLPFSPEASSTEIEDDPTVAFVGLNALEIAAVAGAKKFLSQRIVQKIVNDIWHGDIIFWDRLSIETKRRAQIYNKRYDTTISHTS